MSIEILKKEYPELSEEQVAKFEKFLEIFKEKNSQINLSAIRDDEWIIMKHFVDSLKIVDYIDLEWNWIDLWTGGGFPWLPLKIFYGDKISMVMVDSVQKKVNAVNKFIKELWIDMARAKVARAEKLGHDWEYRERYDFVVSRAVSYFPTLLEYTLPLIKEGGVLVSYKLYNEEELKEWAKALKTLWGKIVQIWEYEIDGQKRALIFVEKTKKTPKGYPRAIWIPLKNPLK